MVPLSESHTVTAFGRFCRHQRETRPTIQAGLLALRDLFLLIQDPQASHRLHFVPALFHLLCRFPQSNGNRI